MDSIILDRRPVTPSPQVAALRQTEKAISDDLMRLRQSSPAKFQDALEQVRERYQKHFPLVQH